MTELYFDTTDISNTNTDFKRGDVVRMYKEGTSLNYPCIVLECEKLELFRVEPIKGILSPKTLIQGEEKQYTLYISIQGAVREIGTVLSSRLRFILNSKIFNTFEKRVHLDKDTTIEGLMLYALCEV